jgi:20S proteasome subunit beta 1
MAFDPAIEAPHTGTTIVACEYADGVVLGADTRVSTGASPPARGD